MISGIHVTIVQFEKTLIDIRTGLTAKTIITFTFKATNGIETSRVSCAFILMPMEQFNTSDVIDLKMPTEFRFERSMSISK